MVGCAVSLEDQALSPMKGIGMDFELRYVQTKRTNEHS
jgi:hypothetical protein